MALQFKRILVAVDGSELGAHALQVASNLAVALSAEIGLVHVIDPKLIGTESGVSADRMWASLDRDGHVLLDTAAEVIPSHSHVWKFLHRGTPSTEIIKSAREWPADLLVVGTHSRTGLARMLLGSTAEAIVGHSTCPVIVVPPAAAVHEAG
jgi:nucleotide-binding universal stress UspA family protein